MSYLDNGFNVFLDKSNGASSGVTALDQDAVFESISGDKIRDGQILSATNRLNMNLATDLFKVGDGVIDRVFLGKISDDEYGLRILDRDGNIILDVTGSNILMQSSSKKMIFDFVKENARWYDQQFLKIILGALEN